MTEQSITAVYAGTVCEKINMIAENQGNRIKEASKLLYHCKNNGGTIYSFGTGHSYMITQEIFARAGGYAGIIPVLENELSMAHPFKSTLIERTAGYAEVIEGLYSFQAGDVIIMTSNSGRNQLIIELALRLKERGVKIIAVTAEEQSSLSAGRHPSGKRLFELADIVLDNYSDEGDASYTHSEEIRTAPTSTITDVFLLHRMVSEFVQMLIDTGVECPVFRSSNVDGSDAYNEELFTMYR